MMKKSLLAVLFSVIFTLVIGTTGVFAAETEPNPEAASALEAVEKTNAKIYKEIDKAVEKSQQLHDKYLTDLDKESDETKRAQITAKYEEKVTDLIAKLDAKTQQMTREGVEKAEKSGLTVEIEWVPVQFADRVAMIDPIKVIDW